MYREVTKDYIKKGLSTIIHDLLKYWNLYDYFKIKAKQIPNKAINIKDIQDFWYSILDNNFRSDCPNVKYHSLQNGQILKFNNFYLSDWIPKLPGKLWTIDGQNKLNESNKYIEFKKYIGDKMIMVLYPDGKERRLAAGYGSVRLNDNIFRQEDYYYCLSLNSKDFWNVDFGIPVVVSKSVYDEYLKYVNIGAPEISFEGILYLNKDLPIKELINSAIGIKVGEEILDILQRSPNLPKCFVYLPSKLTCKLKSNNSHPECTAWTCFESKNHSNTDLLYTYAHFNPISKNSINNAIEFINEYIIKYLGKKILTDFDGKIPRLKSQVNLSIDLVNQPKELKKIYRNWESLSHNVIKAISH